MNFPISEMQSPTLSKESDCFNGRSSVNVKYTRLDIDYELVNERDFPDPPDLEEEEDFHPMDWDKIDANGEDVFDRMGFMLFGGSGIVATIARTVVMPACSSTRRIYRGYFSDIMSYIMLFFGVLLCLELFVRRKIQNQICFCCFGRESEDEPIDADDDLEPIQRETQPAQVSPDLQQQAQAKIEELAKNFYEEIENEGENANQKEKETNK